MTLTLRPRATCLATVLMLASSLYTSNLYAAWYQTTVSIPTQAGSESQLRSLALSDASGQLLGYAGVSMNYQQPLV
ncbi:MAG: hypothetical protein ACRC9E_03065, partial [Plesiomonas shigelloides]